MVSVLYAVGLCDGANLVLGVKTGRVTKKKSAAKIKTEVAEEMLMEDAGQVETDFGEEEV